MLWTKKQLEFSVADTKAIVQDALPQLEEKLGQPIYLTSTGLVTHDQLKLEVTEFLTKGREETSLDLMSFDLDVSRKSLQAALDDVELDRVYFGSIVLPRPVVEAKLEELNRVDQPVLAVEYCKSSNISMKLLEWLCRYAKFVTVEGVLINEAKFTQAKQDFLQELQSRKEPVDLATVVQDVNLRAALLSVYANSPEVPGSIDKSTLVYTPRAYVEAQRHEALNKLGKAGYLSEQGLSEYMIRDVAKFARKNDLVLARKFVITRDYIATQKDTVKSLLDNRGYVVIDEDIELGQALVDAIDIPSRYLNGYSRYLVNPSFEGKLKDQVCADGAEKGAHDAEEINVVATNDLKALLNSISGKAFSLRDVEQRLGDLPEKLQKQIALRISSAVRQAYIEGATKVLQAKLEVAQKQVDLKLGVYLNGVLSLSEPLRETAFREWQQYLSDCDCLPVSDLEAAKEAYVEKASEEALRSSATQIIASQQRKLQATTDPALVLHLAVVVWHAKHHVVGNDGVLRIRGKLVPKVLKAFEFPSCFTSLKKAVVSGENATKLVEEAKQQVLL